MVLAKDFFWSLHLSEEVMEGGDFEGNSYVL